MNPNHILYSHLQSENIIIMRHDYQHVTHQEEGTYIPNLGSTVNPVIARYERQDRKSSYLDAGDFLHFIGMFLAGTE